MNLTLVNPNYEGNPLMESRPRSIFLPNLGIDSIYAYLKENYYSLDITVIDAVLNNMSQKETIKSILNTNPSIVGLSSTYINLEECINILKKIKKDKEDTITILGGIGTKSLYALTKGSHQRGIDYVVMGDGERIIEKIIKNGKIQKKTKYLSDTIFDLDSLPINKRESIDVERYMELGVKVSKTFFGERAIHIWTSKGCDWGKCVFCTIDKNYRVRGIEKIKEELEYLLKKFKFTKFYVYDDNFFSFKNKERMYTLLEMLKGFGGLRWYTAASIRDFAYDLEISRDILKKMNESGCEDISLGIESGSDKMLLKFNKGFTVKNSHEVIKLISESGIKTRLLLMYNYYGETKETLNETLKFVRFIVKNYNIPFLRAAEFVNIPRSCNREHYKKNDLSIKEIKEFKNRLEEICTKCNTKFVFDRHA